MQLPVELERVHYQTPSRTGFLVELYEEHLDEASFLYEQILDGRGDETDLTWTDLADFEERLEAHVDALVLGALLALEIGLARCLEGEPGVLYTFARVCCRSDRRDLVEALVHARDVETDQAKAMWDGLREELPSEWEDLVVDVVYGEELVGRRYALQAVRGRLENAKGAILHALDGDDVGVLAEAIRAAGRLRLQQARPMLHDRLLHGGEIMVRREAAVALLRLGDSIDPHELIRNPNDYEWVFPLVGISGGVADARMMIDALERGGGSTGAAVGLGLLGDPAAIDGLLRALDLEPLSHAAALGLYLITGGVLREDAFVPEEAGEDELFEDEVARLRDGEPLLRPDGEPAGTSTPRLSGDPAVWRAWWETHGTQFETGIRYRLGRPASPRTLIESLRAEFVPFGVRELIYHELAARYGLDAGVDAEASVLAQGQALDRLEREIVQMNGASREGRWYFKGQLQSSRGARG